MALILRQSTAIDVLIGPFVDKTDGATAEEGESPSVLLSKNGQTLAAKNDATTPVHDDAGYYNCELDATDTNTVGQLVLIIEASANALPVRHEFLIVEEATYDFLYASGATPIADINAEADTALADYDGPTKAELDALIPNTLNVTASGNIGIDWANVENPTTALDLSGTDIQLCDTVTTNTDMRGTDSAATATALATAQADLDTLTGADGATLATAQGNYAPAKAGDAMALTAAAVDAVWDETMTAHATADSAAVHVKDIFADTNELQSDDIPGAISALNDPTAAAIADQVWEEAIADHSGTGGSTAEQLAAAGAAGDPWSTALPGAYGAGTAGKIVGDNLNATVSSRSSHSAADVWSVATRVLTANTNLNDLDAAGVRTALGMAAADLDTQLDALPTAAENRAEMDSNSTQLAAIVADTNELQSDDVPGLIAALENISVADLLTTQMTEAYAANGVAPTVAQALFALHQMLMAFAISGTALSVKKLDGSTEAFEVTLDDDTSPTAAARN